MNKYCTIKKEKKSEDNRGRICYCAISIDFQLK